MTRTRSVLILMIGVTLILMSAAACQRAASLAPPAPDYAAELGPNVEAFRGAWNTGDVDKLDAIASSEYKRRAPDQNAENLDEMKEFIRNVRTAYSDFHIEFIEVFYAENAATFMWTVTGTNDGEGEFPPTGKSIEISGITVLLFAGGMITEEIVSYDTATMTSQLGISNLPHVGSLDQ